jgi:hypothetical protein
VKIVNYFHPDHAQLITYPETDHNFAKLGSMQDAWDIFAAHDYQKIFDLYNEEVGKSAVRWSNNVINKN